MFPFQKRKTCKTFCTLFVIFGLIFREFNPKYLTKLSSSSKFFILIFLFLPVPSILRISHTLCSRKRKRKENWRLRSKWRNFYQRPSRLCKLCYCEERSAPTTRWERQGRQGWRLSSWRREGAGGSKSFKVRRDFDGRAPLPSNWPGDGVGR